MIRMKTLLLFLLLVHTKSSLSSNCGKEGGVRTRISGGHIAQPHRYPWMVSFSYYPHGKSGQWFCSGSLVSQKIVLTAKHCADNVRKWGTAKVGVHDVSENGKFQEVHFEKILFHKTVFDRSSDNDFAILVLKDPVDLKDARIGLVCLPETGGEKYLGEPVRTMGWGMVRFNGKGGEWGDYLKAVDLEVVDEDDKLLIYTKVENIDGVYQDPCSGDSGGPLLHREGRRWVIIATINGLGYDCNQGVINGKGMFNKVAPHLDWIKKQIAKYTKSSHESGRKISEEDSNRGNTRSKTITDVNATSSESVSSGNASTTEATEDPVQIETTEEPEQNDGETTLISIVTLKTEESETKDGSTDDTTSVPNGSLTTENTFLNNNTYLVNVRNKTYQIMVENGE